MRPLLLLACVPLLACAARTDVQRPLVPSAGEFYDSAAEWNADNRDASAVAPREPVRRRRPSYQAYVSEPPARSLSSSDVARSRSVQDIVYEAARAHAVPPDLVNGIIWVESRFHPRARSSKGARGLMQLMPRTGAEVARALGMRYDPYDPRFNIHAGTYYFARLVERFDGNLTLALAAYNVGPGRVEQWLREHKPLPSYSRNYAENVFSAARAFRARDALRAVTFATR